MAKWTLITNHAAVLLHIAQNPRTTAREIAAACSITERASRKIIADLDQEHFISKKKEGRRIFYTINPDIKMIHDTVQDVAVGKFLETLGWQKVTVQDKTIAETGKKPVLQAYRTPEQQEKLIDEFYAHLF